MNTVPNPTPERESALCGDAWHYTTTTGPCPTCGDHGPTWTTDPDTLQQVADGLREPDEQVDQPTAPEPEVRHTFAVVVIDDQLRRASTLPELFPDVHVVTVHGVGDRRIVMDTDADWRTQIGDRPALILARMLAAAAWADTVAGAELLMPGPDVLTALAGQPDAGWWSTPIRVPYRDVRPGWLVLRSSLGGEETRHLVTARTECVDDNCANRQDGCVVLTMPGSGEDPDVHCKAWPGAYVRLPADFVVDSVPAPAVAL